MVSLALHSPVAARRVRTPVPLAPRVDGLDGRTIGLYWNLKAGGDVALRRIAAGLARRFPGIELRDYTGSAGARPTMTAGDADRIANQCDAVIGGTADTGGSASWLAHDMILVEERRVPTVALVASGMVDEWHRSAAAFGLPALRGAIIPHGLASTPRVEIESFADAALEQLVAALVGPFEGPAPEPGDPGHDPADTLIVEGADELDAATRMNERFLELGWGDGLPLVPPTRTAVDRMLTGTPRDRSEVVAVLEPLFGIATVEKVAVNAVLAGARAEHLPVLLAAVEAVADPRFMLRDAIASTGIRALLLLVNGPIRHRVGLNCGTNALGPGAPSRANLAIGRAMRLIYMNVAGGYPGSVDVGTIGLPTKLGLCAGENEEASPWEPYHVELGFPAEVSTVTAKTVFGATETHIRREPGPEAILDLAVSAAESTGAHIGWVTGGTADPDKGIEVQPQNMWLICPEHARLLAQHGYTKERVRRYLYERARIPAGKILARYEVMRGPDGSWLKNPHLQYLEGAPDLRVPVASDPRDFRLAVVGGPGPRGVWFWGHEEAVTRAIEEPV